MYTIICANLEQLCTWEVPTGIFSLNAPHSLCCLCCSCRQQAEKLLYNRFLLLTVRFVVCISHTNLRGVSRFSLKLCTFVGLQSCGNNPVVCVPKVPPAPLLSSPELGLTSALSQNSRLKCVPVRRLFQVCPTGGCSGPVGGDSTPSANFGFTLRKMSLMWPGGWVSGPGHPSAPYGRTLWTGHCLFVPIC